MKNKVHCKKKYVRLGGKFVRVFIKDIHIAFIKSQLNKPPHLMAQEICDRVLEETMMSTSFGLASKIFEDIERKNVKEKRIY